jgi:hypothetical protein
MVRYYQQKDRYKLNNFMHSSLFVSREFLIKFFPLMKPPRFGVLFGYDQRKVPTEVLDALKGKLSGSFKILVALISGASDLLLHCDSVTPSINYALSTFGSNLDHLHCKKTQFLRSFIDGEHKLKFKHFSGDSGKLVLRKLQQLTQFFSRSAQLLIAV